MLQQNSAEAIFGSLQSCFGVVFQVLVGDLPSDFLRLNTSADHQVAVDHHTAAMMQAQAAGVQVFAPSVSRLSITIAQVTNHSIFYNILAYITNAPA